jgi:uncharacterized damage-inducible protein DinB
LSANTQTREQILDAIDTNWNHLIETFRSFSVDEFDAPNVVGVWSLKDLVGHIETWDRIAITALENAEVGKTTAWWKIVGVERRGLDQFNEADADNDRHRSLDDLWAKMIATHEELVRKIEESTALSREAIEEHTYEHYREHLDDIRDWQARRL